MRKSNILLEKIKFERILRELLRDLYFLQKGLIESVDLSNINDKSIDELYKLTDSFDYSIITSPKKKLLIENLTTGS